MTRLLLVPAVLLALIASAAPAHALQPPTSVTFEGLADGTDIVDQYATGTRDDVRFGSAGRFGQQPPRLDCGSPSALSGGITGVSADIACRTGSSEFPDRAFGTSLEFREERRNIQFDLLQRTAQPSLTATIKYYGVGRALLGTQTVTLAQNATRHVIIDRGVTPDVVGVQVFGDGLDYGDNGRVLLDNLTALLDDTPPPPKWTLALEKPAVDVVEGSTASAPLSVRRYNGSSGAVTINVGALPGGIVATRVTPNPVTGENPTTLSLTADSPFTGTADVPISASGSAGAGTGFGTTATLTATGLPAVLIYEGGRYTRTVVAGCGPQRFAESFAVRGGYTGRVAADPYAVTRGIKASSDPLAQYVTGDGQYDYGLIVTPAGAAPGAIDTVRLRTFPGGGTQQQADVAFRTVAIGVSGTAPSLFLPQPGTTGRLVIRGTFPEICPVTFKDPLGQVLKATRGVAQKDDGGTEDQFTVEIPDNEISGPITIHGPGDAELARTAPIDVREFRNTYGFNQANDQVGGGLDDYTWDDFQNTFGDDDTEICFIFCAPDPVALGYFWKIQGDIQSKSGMCSGYTQMALRFRGWEGGLKASQYQAGAARPYDLAFSETSAIKHAVAKYQGAQFDQGFSNALDDARDLAPAAEIARLRYLISTFGGAYVSIRQGDGGHAVIATGIKDLPNGAHEIRLADPNAPYGPRDLTERAARLTKNTITIQANGDWAGANFPWKGSNKTLGVPDKLPPNTSKLPFSFSLLSLFDGSGDGGAPAADITGIAAGGKALLRADGEPKAGSGVDLTPVASGLVAQPEYRLRKGRAYTVNLRGTGKGVASQALLGDHTMAGVSAPMAAGKTSAVTLTPGKPTVGFAGKGGGTLEYRVADQAGKETRLAYVKTGAGKVSLAGGAVDVRSARGGKATITLGSVGRGIPGSVTTAGIRLAAGQRLQLRPRSWRNVAGGVKLVVRNARGRVVRRGRARLRATRAVSLSGVRAKRKGRAVTVTGRVGKPGSTPILAAVIGRKAVTLRGAKVKKGRFTLRLRNAPKGRRIVIKLLDQDAGLAGVTKRVRVR